MPTLEEGHKALRQGDLPQAKRIFRAILEKNRYSEEAWLGLGDAFTDANKKRVCYENVLRLNKQNKIAPLKLRSLELQVELLRKVEEQANLSPVVAEIKQHIRDRVITDTEVCELRGDWERLNEDLWQTTLRDKCRQILSQEYTRLKPTDREKLLAEIVADIPTPSFTFEDLKRKIQARLLADPEVNELVATLNGPTLDLDKMNIYEIRNFIRDKYEQILAQEYISFNLRRLRRVVKKERRNLLDEIMLEIPVTTLQRVFDGRQFTFIQADEQHPVTMRVDGVRQTYRTPTILSHHLYHISSSINIMSFGHTLPLLHWLSVTTDRQIYRPGETAAIFIAAPGMTEQVARLEIHRGIYNDHFQQFLVIHFPQSSKIYEADVPLNANGLALHYYENLPEGEYTVLVILSASQRQIENEGTFSTFSVTEYTLSPFNATLEEYAFEDRHLFCILTLSLLSSPYIGPVEVGLQSGHSDRLLVKQTIEVRDGFLRCEFDLSRYGGKSLYAQIVTPEGNTTLVALPHSGSQQVDAIRVNALGQTAALSLLPQEDDEPPVRGLYLRSGQVNMTPLILESAYAGRGRLQATVDLDQVQVVVFDPFSGESQVIEQSNLAPGHVIEFEVTPPYSLFTVGAFTAAGEETGPFEGWGTVIKPLAFEASLTAPATAQPGQEIDVGLKLKPASPDGPSPGAFCWLLVYDARLGHKSPLPKLAQDIFGCIRKFTKKMAIGTVYSYITQLTDTAGPRGEYLVTPDGEDGYQERSLPARERSWVIQVIKPSGSLTQSLRSTTFSSEAQGRLMLSPDCMVEVNPIRMDFPELVYQALFYVEGEAWRSIKLGDQLGDWRIRAYLFQGADYCELTADVHTEKPVYAELNLPALCSPGDDITATVDYHTPDPADLLIATPWGETRRQVSGRGREPVALSGPGRIEARLEGPFESDWTLRDVAPPGLQSVTTSRLLPLARGQTVEAERVVVYPHVGLLLWDTIAALADSSFGCAEQTSSALYGLAMAYRGISHGFVPGDAATTQGRIMAGLHHLAAFQHKDGLFSIWQERSPDLDITARVAHRLLGLHGLPLSPVEQMVNQLLTQAKKALLGNGYRDNVLLPLGLEFGREMSGPEDAVAYYFAGDELSQHRQSALSLLRQTVQHEGQHAFWPAQSAWGGSLEVTADAARVMYDAGDDLFQPAFTFVTGHLVDGMLYSTADTRALVELLACLKFAPSARAVIDGQEVALTERTVGRQVTALNDNLLVRLDEEIELNHLLPRANLPFEVTPSRTRLKLGERLHITITPKLETIAPMARLFLPGHLALLKSGVNAQTAHLPIKGEALTVEAVAIRSGRAKLNISVHDMYDAQKVGTSPGIEIKVEERQ